ncbi:hypothetical protein LCGC14_2847150 [marine sediment metagenome]|uniref:Uncharacterized protein n=1 Tax=marine sediment metagenome TaxID=412755 RepID=A0A0F8Y9L9_9ZZZZ
MSREEILVRYLAQHNALSTRKDAPDKALFDQQHRQIWADCDAELKARYGELKGKTALTTEEQTELRELNFR